MRYFAVVYFIIYMPRESTRVIIGTFTLLKCSHPRIATVATDTLYHPLHKSRRGAVNCAESPTLPSIMARRCFIYPLSRQCSV